MNIAGLTQLALDNDLPFLVVGGHAVILHGVPRFTRDLDLVIPDDSISFWETFLGKLQFRLYHRTGAFLQYEPDGVGGMPPIDLMLVDAPTWQKLLERSMRCEAGNGMRLPVPHPWHLIAMKLQASTSSTRRTDASDWPDIFQLIRVCQIDSADPAFQAIVLRYGGKAALERITQQC